MPVESVSRLLNDERLLAAILDATPNAWLFIDADGRARLVSRAFRDFFGLAPADVIGRTLNDFEPAWSRTFSETMSYHETVSHPFQDRETRFFRDVEISLPQHRFLEMSSEPVHQGGVFAGRFWIIRDVTSEREITELKIRYGGQRNADEIKSKFLTVASHQLRTPMNAMRWNLDLLLSGDAGPIEPGPSELLREVYKSLVVSLSIIDDMLLAVDIEQRALRLEKTSVDIAGVVGKVVHEFARSAELRKQTLVLRAHEDLPPLFVDAGRLEKVFVRLIDNAIKYTPDGGRIEVEIHSTKDAVSVSVRDSGIGISEPDRARLFERFFRSKEALDLNPNASGLGLYIAKFLVAAHDGTIEYRAADGGGSVFTVVLPRRAAI